MKKYLDRSRIITEIRLYGYTEQFDKIYDILQKNNLLSDEQFSYIAFLSKVKLGMISEENLENLKSYKKNKDMNTVKLDSKNISKNIHTKRITINQLKRKTTHFSVNTFPLIE